MKILAFSDIHGSKRALINIVKRASEDDIDFLICAGDLSDFGEDLTKLALELNNIGKPVYMLHGNHEMHEDIIELAKKFKYIIDFHGKYKIIGDVLLLGWGGGGFSLIDKRFEKFGKLVSKLMKQHKKVILATHAPPYKTKLDVVGSSHVGNKSILNFITKYQPTYSICGHIHECAGIKQKNKNSLMINLGPKGFILNF